MTEPDAPPSFEPAHHRNRSRMAWGGVAVLLVVSVVVFMNAPVAPNSQVAMGGQGLPSTSLGEIVDGPEALVVGFVPSGFTLVAEESDGVDRVVQRYERDDGDRQVLVITTVDGTFNAARALGASTRAEPVAVGALDGVLQRSVNEAGEEELTLRVQVGDSHNVIVRGVGGVPLDDLVAVAASAQES